MRISLLRFFAIIVVFTYQSTAIASDAEWSFDRHPIPNLNSVSLEERLLVARAYPILDEASTENAIDRFKPLYAKIYPSAPVILDGTLLENRFLHHLIKTQTATGFGQQLAIANRDRLREYADEYMRKTGRIICSLRIPDPTDWPFLDETLQTVRTGLQTPEWVFPLFGVFFAKKPDSINWASELRLLFYARIDLGFGRPIRPVAPQDLDRQLSAQSIATIQAAARRADIDAVLDMVGECWKR